MLCTSRNGVVVHGIPKPMLNAGSPEVRVLEDGWTVVTDDGPYLLTVA